MRHAKQLSAAAEIKPEMKPPTSEKRPVKQLSATAAKPEKKPPVSEMSSTKKPCPRSLERSSLRAR
jgi:hypothetical protein